MLKPSANIIKTPHMNQYSLVIAVAKRARQIAVQDFVQERYRIVEPESLEE